MTQLDTTRLKRQLRERTARKTAGKRTWKLSIDSRSDHEVKIIKKAQNGIERFCFVWRFDWHSPWDNGPEDSLVWCVGVDAAKCTISIVFMSASCSSSLRCLCETKNKFWRFSITMQFVESALMNNRLRFRQALHNGLVVMHILCLHQPRQH